MTYMKKSTHSLGRLARDNKGAALPIIAVSLAVLVLAAGGAIDASRAQLVEAKLSSSLDAAGLAAGSTINTANHESEANKFFYANYPADYLGSTVTSLTSNINADNTIITLTATATVPTTLLRLAGIDQFTVSVESEITRANRGIEIVLVVDNSGSMNNSAGGGLSRLEALQAASHTLVDILYGGDQAAENLWMGIVPFAQGVNIGTSRGSWYNDGNHFWGIYPWEGCVEARASTGRDTTDDPPATQRFDQYYARCLNHFDYDHLLSVPNSWFGNDFSRRNCNGGFYRSNASNATWGPNQYCPQRMTQLTSSRSIIEGDIDSLEAVGSTHTNLGAVWAWRMLSPRWRGLWGGEMNTEGLPLDYNEPNMEKAVVILSDGANQHINANYSSYRYLSDGLLGTTSSFSADNRLDDRTKDVCDAMKNNNVIIYTVAFGTSISQQGRDLMQDCASKDDFYFESPSVADLNSAFNAIGDSLANLRVSK